MILKLLKSRPRTVLTPPAVPVVPPGMLIWAIGDVHGRLDLLKPLVEAILIDASETPADRKMVIFLGDYVDRGPDSRGVLQYLVDLTSFSGIEWRFLKGNHEEAMLNFLVDPTTGGRWCEYGGDATLLSYGLRPPNLRHRAEGWARVSADLHHKMTASEREFLENLELSVSIGDYFFAHAGARPGQPLDRQSQRDLMWIRGSFLDSDVAFNKVVVHGHTPTPAVYVDQRRIGVDTKAYDSDMLTALRLKGENRSVVQAILEDKIVHTRRQMLAEKTEAGAGR
ncbi:metallophosphoesterase family protein [Brevundimonas basaltis]|uniref:Serine/threonine protein phosphatase 1 n=1 Tax=Brevundimonas basaltis TaxID=472166 RepID=A0A7W8HZA9_9CAUL|nr:metallophosphoesterase family protein [Brevundimonas basaltis]MBB5292656.1 serine/threonine protein phosphatase 1 [Brevundimonas basaltis]